MIRNMYVISCLLLLFALQPGYCSTRVEVIDDSKYLIEASSEPEGFNCPHGILGLHYPTDGSKLYVSVKQGPAYFGQVINTYQALLNNELALAVSLSPTAEGRHAFSYLLTGGKGYSPQDKRLSNCTHVLISKLLREQVAPRTSLKNLFTTGSSSSSSSSNRGAMFTNPSLGLKAQAQRALWDRQNANKSATVGILPSSSNAKARLQQTRVEMTNENIIANFSKNSQVAAALDAVPVPVPVPTGRAVQHKKRQSIDVQCFESSAGVDSKMFNSMYANLREQPRNVQVVFENKGDGASRAVFKAGPDVSLVVYHDGVVVTTMRSLLPLIVAAQNECFQKGATRSLSVEPNSHNSTMTPKVLAGIKSRTLGMTIYIVDSEQASLI